MSKPPPTAWEHILQNTGGDDTPKKPVEAEATYTLYFMDWLETEAGWGIRPDGYSLHMTVEGYKAWLDAYWARETEYNRKANTEAGRPPGAVPAEYSRPSWDAPKLVRVPKKVYEQVKEKGDVRGYERGVHMDASQTLVGLTDLNTK